MSKQLLIPVRSLEDADDAFARIPEVAENGDQVVVVVVSEMPERRMIGSEPSPITMEPLHQAGTGFSTPAPPSDIPVFEESGEVMDRESQEIRNRLADKIAMLNDRGYDARVEAVFSDDPAATIRDMAGDLGTNEVYVTSAFYDDLKSDDEDIARVLP